MNIYQERNRSEYYIKVNIGRYATEMHKFTLMHNDDALRVYQVQICSIAKLSKQIQEVYELWTKAYNTHNIDVIIDSTMLESALLDLMTDSNSSWVIGPPEDKGEYFVVINGKVKVVQNIVTKVEAINRGRIVDSCKLHHIQDIDGKELTRYRVTHHQEVTPQKPFTKTKLQEDGWYYVKLMNREYLGYLSTRASVLNFPDTYRLIKTFEGATFHPSKVYTFSPVTIPEFSKT